MKAPRKQPTSSSSLVAPLAARDICPHVQRLVTMLRSQRPPAASSDTTACNLAACPSHDERRRHAGPRSPALQPILTLARMAERDGIAAAWQESLRTRAPRAAAEGVDGDFAVAIARGFGPHLPRGRPLRDPHALLPRAGRPPALRRARRRSWPTPAARSTRRRSSTTCTSTSSRRRAPSSRACIGCRPATAHGSRSGELQVEPYWVPRFEPARRRRSTRCKAEFRHLLRQAVARQLDGSKPACFLSGGTDSSTVAGMIGDVAGQPAAALLDRLRGRGLRRDGVRAHRGAPLRHRAPRVLRDARRPGRGIPAVAAALRPAVRQLVGAAGVLLRAQGARTTA